MGDGAQRREIHVLVADSSGDHVLSTTDGDLPHANIELLEGESTVSAAHRTSVDLWDLATPVLEVYFDDDMAHDDVDSLVVPTLVVMESALEQWRVPAGLRWRPLADANPKVSPGLSKRSSELLREWRGGGDVPSLRPRWSRPGWYDEAAAWITERLDETGRPPIGPIEQVRHWGISALMRVQTESGRAWFKAVFPLFASEPAVTELLHRERPGCVAPVLAIDREHGWLLLDDVGSSLLADHPQAQDDAFRALVGLQRTFVDRTSDLAGVGCRIRPFASLADDLEVMLSDQLALEWIDVTPSRATQIVDWIRDAAHRMAGLPFPDTLVHGDFHPGNVALVDGRPVIFDWSDAAVAHPMVDITTWTSWTRDDAERCERAWQVFAEAWSDVCSRGEVESARSLMAGLGNGYHAVSYAGIAAGLEPLRRSEMADGLTSYFERLDAAVPR